MGQRTGTCAKVGHQDLIKMANNYGFEKGQEAFSQPHPPPYTTQPMSAGYPAQSPFVPPPSHGQQTASNVTVVMTQPGPSVRGPRDWNSGVCSCCDDFGICCFGTWCGICLACQVSTDMGESMCVPCCVPGWLIALRLKMRVQEKIPGSLLDDCCVTMCCGACVLCQLAREVKFVQLLDSQGTTNQMSQF